MDAVLENVYISGSVVTRFPILQSSGKLKFSAKKQAFVDGLQKLYTLRNNFCVVMIILPVGKHI